MNVFYNKEGMACEKPKGKEVVWRPSAFGVLKNEKGEWLMVQPSWSTRLDLPGGGIKSDELLMDGMVREFYEETGYRVEPAGQPVFVGERYFVEDDIWFHYVTIVYEVSLTSEKRDEDVVNTFEDGYEIVDSRWVDPLKLKEDDCAVIFWPYVKSLQDV